MFKALPQLSLLSAIECRTLLPAGTAHVSPTRYLLRAAHRYVDLGAGAQVTGVEVFSRDGCCTQRIGDLEVRLGDTIPGVPGASLGTAITSNTVYAKYLGPPASASVQVRPAPGRGDLVWGAFGWDARALAWKGKCIAVPPGWASSPACLPACVLSSTPLDNIIHC